MLDRELPAGSRVHGRVDWHRRFDHMQQHTGQHILSAAFDRLSAARTVGFHLGADVSTVDLSIPLSPEAIAAAEAEANRVVWEDRPVAIRFVSDAEAAALPLRKEPDRTGILRVIDVEGYDLSACGGTHVARTGGIGAHRGAVVRAAARRHTRSSSCAAAARFGRSTRTATRWPAASGTCRWRPRNCPRPSSACRPRARTSARRSRASRSAWPRYQAAAMAARAERVNGVKRLVEAVEGQDQGGLKAMAIAICAAPGFEVALFSAAEPFVVVVARSRDGRLDAADVLRTLLARFGGRGGGKAGPCPGRGPHGNLQEMLDAARAAMTR